MDDSCAVCAEPLEWVAYGACGHREVCSTCVVRLRFVLNDSHCCICKSLCPSVFITKAMGDYTRVITDFASFPAANQEGPVTGGYWYHEDTQAYFDDSDQYKMIRAMCRLSCSVCDKAGTEEPGSRRRNRFRSVEQLKGHLFHQHRLFMCSLCLEGRKIFICEQKLYTRLQLNQHIKSGDSEVDGSESGFSGHPLCVFCNSPFYGDNEIYMHMSTEHYKCHICQRQHPGQHDYFHNYDDLEAHFREAHFLCGSDDCLAKKFVVFQNEQELKRHNATEHGGKMSRAQRSAALQIPTSFRYRRSEQEQRSRGRGRGINFLHDTSSSDQDSFQDPVYDAPVNSLTNSLSSTSLSSSALEQSSFPPLHDPSDSRIGSATDQSSAASRYSLALNQNARGATALVEASFPPLPGAAPVRNPGTGAVPQQGLQTLAKHHAWQRRKSVGTVKLVKPRPPENRAVPPSFPALQSQHNNNAGIGTSSGSSSSRAPSFPSLQSQHNSNTGIGTSSGATSSKAKIKQPTISNNVSQAGSSSSNPKVPKGVPVPVPVPAVPPLPVQEAVINANKSLVERIKVDLDNDEERYELFKSISSEYRNGDMGTLEYLSCVEQFKLSHMVPELARLLPDKHKQRELTEAYYTNLRFKNLTESSRNGNANKGISSKNASGSSNNSKGSKKGKEKDTRADNFLETVRKLQSNQRVNEEVQTEVLSKGGYRGSSNKAKSVVSLSAQSSNNTNGSNISSKTQDNENKSGEGATSGGTKQKAKKTSKFLRARLGDGSVAALFDPNRKDPSPEKDEIETGMSGNNGTVRGVWRNGGGQKLAKGLFK